MRRWDIFCKVVDNFGDIGVCWRLAKQLASEHGLQVRLFVDDLNTAKQLIPQFYTNQQLQTIEQVSICHWSDTLAITDVADVVIEAFACDLPPHYITLMLDKKPVWLNLEYLSAEDWVEESHLMPSPHPQTGLKKHFFFPGFSQRTGGLIKEKHLLKTRDAFIADAQCQHQFLSTLGVSHQPSQILFSLFCYTHANIHGLLQAMSTAEQPVLCLVPNTGIADSVARFFKLNTLDLHQTYQHGHLTVQVIPFLSQHDYDRLLWSCDFNFVRGEDSWVRAIWAAKPFIWQPYPQEMDTSLQKLNAFLQRYGDPTDNEAGILLREAHLQWLQSQALPFNMLMKQLNRLKKHAIIQSQRLSQLQDLAAQLVAFAKEVGHDYSRK